MKKTSLVLLLVVAFAVTKAQNFLEKIPSTSTVVIKIDAGQMSNLLPNKKFNEFRYIQKLFRDFAVVDDKFDVGAVGVDLTKTCYGFYAPVDTNNMFVFMMPMKDVKAFTTQVLKKYPDADLAKKMNGYTIQKLSDMQYLIYNDDKLALVTAMHTSSEPSYFKEPYPSRYGEEGEETVAATVAMAADDVAVAVEAAPAEDYQEPAVKKKVAPKKPLTPAQKAAEARRKREEAARLKKEKEAEKKAEREYQAKLDAYQERENEFYEKKRMKTAEIQEKITKEFATKFFSAAVETPMITANPQYAKLIDANAPVTGWYNSIGLLNQYYGMLGSNYFLGRSLLGEVAHEAARAQNMAEYKANVFSGANVYFDAKEMRVESKSYSPDKVTNDRLISIFNSKQSDKLAQLVNPGALAVISSSINNEALINYYYSFFKDGNYLKSVAGAKFTEEMEIVVDAIEIALDEKGIADLAPGNTMAVLHDLKPRKVKYITYEYDNDYNKKEVTKEKTELSPEFTIAIETKREDFVNKLLRLPLKYDKDGGKATYVDKGNYFEILIKEGELPISNLYVLAKNGQVVLTTSKAVVDNVIGNKGFATSGSIIDGVKNNNMYLSLDAKSLIAKVGPELGSKNSQKMIDYLRDNAGQTNVTTSVIDGVVTSKVNLGINGQHANSLEYVFNLIAKFNELMEEKDAESQPATKEN